MSKYQTFAVCKIFESKPAVYFSDDDYYITPIGSFIATNFSINNGTIYSQNTSSVSLPQHVNMSKPFKIGDIVEVSVIDVPIRGIALYGYNSKIISGIPSRRAFVITAMDASTLTLTDYVEFDLSYSTVGYVGTVDKIPVNDLLKIFSDSSMRAFACRKVNGSIFNVNDKTKTNLKTSFSDDFESTNVKPYDVLLKALQNILTVDSVAFSLHATVEHDGVGWYVFPVVRQNATRNDISLRIKPSTNITMTTDVNTNIATVWIQPDENADDYIRAGVAVALGGETTSTVTSINNVSKEHYSGFGITESGSVLIGFTQLIEKVAEKSENEENTETEDNKKQSESEAWTKKIREVLKPPLTNQFIKQLFSDAFETLSITNTEIDAEIYELMVKNLRTLIKNTVSKPFTPIELTVGDLDFYNTNVSLTGEENITMWYNHPFGGSLNGVSARCINVEYTPNGRTYTLRSSTYRGLTLDDL